MAVGYRGVPTALVRIIGAGLDNPAAKAFGDLAKAVQNIAIVLNGVLSGKTNNVGTVTCTVNQATTVVLDDRISPNSAMPLDSETAAAATELGAGGCYWSSRGKGTATLTHSNSATTGRDFRFPING